ncbi:hypothetical protein [Actinokineospora globicatena]|uniref:Uncharacterized protein n=1 Tax=Actinokineospora globicatena TaxID=103729 RepID=A0A9W6V747_9PSEU|nr:hypothetical protein [Actinokineospora globicatena]GLW92345.1 hypothetical protein Aglo03_31610 [Actinokineospora globicatena]
MTDDVRDLLGRALGDEPPLGIDREAVFADGRRRLRRRRVAATGGVAAAVAVAVFGAAMLSSGAIGLSQPEVLPAAPPSVTTTRVPAPVEPVPTTPTKAPSSTITTHRPRQVTALRDGVIWPAGVRPQSSKSGREWYEFDDDGEIRAVLTTAKGDRILQVRVYFTAAREHMIDCPSVQNGAKLPNCYVGSYGNAKVRTERDSPTDGPAVVLVTADRADSVTVEVMETAGDHGRLDQVLPDSTILKIATLPGLTP